MRLKQHAMIDVAAADGEKPTCIFERSLNVYDKATLVMSPVRGWVRRIKEAIARVIPQSLQLQWQLTFASLGLFHKSQVLCEYTSVFLQSERWRCQ